MRNSLTERAEEIFCEAFEIADPAARAAFVESYCAGNADLRAEVQAMLAAQSEADSFFQASVAALRPSQDSLDGAAAHASTPGIGLALLPEEKPGARIGSYTLLQEIGQGGCGVVYMAEQEEPVRRRVALKIIKLGMDTRSVIARFRAEQQALALMDHPNIAQVLDAGATAAGRPYFIMELVRGIRLTNYCDERRLEVRERLKLFIQICHAIQHAHQKGIIHRDIKPSNILVASHDDVAVPKVIDFGIAKAVEGRLSDQTPFTAHDQFIGTPAYMSPEQAETSGLDVDTRSDIYSLGVLLYELLTGKTPFDTRRLLQGGVDELRRTLRERDPERPSTAVSMFSDADLTQTAQKRRLEPVRLVSQLRGDLDWIVMKALEKDRTRRYQTANGLAMDVQRYLDNEPVLARPPSQLYRLRKLVRRNKIVFLAGSITAVALVASSGISTWLLFQERAARQRALLAEEQKGTLQQEADRLRASVLAQQKLADAAVLFKQGKLEDADALLDGLVNPKAAPEHASMFRTLGDWHAANHRWLKAKARFDVLFQLNEIEGVDSTMDDIRSAAVLVHQGFLEEYERFRESLVARYAGTGNPTIAQRVVRECLLTPANEELMGALSSYADVAESPFRKPDPGRNAPATSWQAYALALMAYRKADYAAAVDWSQRADATSGGLPTLSLSVRLIRAMSLQQLGRGSEARAELERCRNGIQTLPGPDAVWISQWKGFWFDLVCIQIHFNEATVLIGNNTDAPN